MNATLDSHICYFMLGSYNMDINDLNISIASDGIDFDTAEQMSVLDYSFQVNHLPKSHKQLISWSAKYARAGCEIKLKRRCARYIILWYVPSGLLVAVSWVSTTKY